MSDTTTQNTQYMLLFTIGPVQSFIAQARKTRDLWLGSYLLSVLMDAGINGSMTEEEVGKNLIFPAKSKVRGNVPDLPNRYVAIFDESRAKKVADDTEIKIKECWNTLCEEVWQAIFVKAQRKNKHQVNVKVAEEIWRQQKDPDKFFEIFWVIVARKNGEEYGDWLERTQAALAARKRLRHVTSGNQPEPTLEESGEKSTISGDRAALRGEGIYRPQVRQFWSDLTAPLSPLDINKQGEERLDTIDTVKRFAFHSSLIWEKLGESGKKRKDGEIISVGFPSTSSIATASFVEALIRHGNVGNVGGIVDDWLGVTTNDSLSEMPPHTIPFLFYLAGINLRPILERDGDCYFSETFVPTRLEKDYNVSKERSNIIAPQGQKALSKLLKGAKELDITLPSSYYAMIQMDGDKMGKLLGEVNSRDEHSNISKALSDYSEEAKLLVEEHYPGRLIYAGGDDVFALAPLARDSAPNGEPLTVLQLADKLQQTYQDIVKPAVGADRRQDVTASTGIAIAHHFTSLSYVRRASKDAESQAKKTYGRNSLVVTLLRRSGEQTRVGCRWTYDNYTMKRKGEDGKSVEVPLHPIDIFSEFYRLFKEDKLSPKLVYLLLEEAPALVHPALFRSYENEHGLSDEEQEKARKAWENTAISVSEMQKSEIKRVLRRQRSSKDDVSDDDTIRLADNLVTLATAMDADTRKSNQNAQATSQEKTRAVELHSEDRRYGLVEVLGWLQVMVFLTRKEQE